MTNDKTTTHASDARLTTEDRAQPRDTRAGIALVEPRGLTGALILGLFAIITISTVFVASNGGIYIGEGLRVELLKDVGFLALVYLLLRISASEIRAGLSALERTFGRREAELVELSTTDKLTGAHNRRYFDEALTREWETAIRLEDSIAIALVDLDCFKAINDEQGHQAGDECLLLVAEVLKQELRYPRTLVVRYGGDEFAVLMPNMTELGCCNMLESVRARIEKLKRPPAARLSVSIGVASCRPTQGQSPNGLIRLADERLYDAKRAGRNQVCVGQATRSDS